MYICIWYELSLIYCSAVDGSHSEPEDCNAFGKAVQCLCIGNESKAEKKH